MPNSPATRLLPDELIAQGRAALMEGDRDRARALLQQAVDLDPRSDEAWVWLAGTHTEPDEMARCLRRALAANPLNEQAQEGLQWLADQHGIATNAPPPMPHGDAPATHESPSVAPAGSATTHRGSGSTFESSSSTHTAAPVTHSDAPRPRRVRERALAGGGGWIALLESALLPFAAGALLGLLRLTAWLWPATLALVRADAEPVGWGGALGIALAAALTHGLALLPAWIAIGWGVSRARRERRGDLFDSLVRAGHVWTPTLLWSGALGATFIGLRLGPLGWRLMSITALMLLATGLILLVRRLWRLLGQLQVPARERRRGSARLIIVAILAAAPSLLLAGWITAALLQ